MFLRIQMGSLRERFAQLTSSQGVVTDTMPGFYKCSLKASQTFHEPRAYFHD